MLFTPYNFCTKFKSAPISMPLHVMAYFGEFPCECGLERYVSLLIMFVSFWGCVFHAVYQPHQPAEGKPSIR